MSTLWLVCGPAGAGKSTWIKEKVNEYLNQGIDAVWLSRDATRFSLLKEDEDYFAKEDEVLKTWISNINKALNLDIAHVFVDATHLNEKSRNAVLDKLNLEKYDIRVVNFKTPLYTCLEQNEKRKGVGRTYVPHGVIRRMHIQFKPATYNEKYDYADIIDIGGEMKDV
jgi:predicted kinase